MKRAVATTAPHLRRLRVTWQDACKLLLFNVEGYGIRPPAYRLPGAAHPGRVRLQVSKLDASRAYYGDLLGMHELDHDAEHVSFGSPTTVRSLVDLQHRTGIHPIVPGTRLGLFHFAILLPTRTDLGRLMRHLLDHRVRFGSADHLVSEAIYLWDPDGLGIEVYVDRPRDAWTRRGSQLAMTTDPLDLDSLLAAGGSKAWHGMPDHTTLGHVHLTVDDLTVARSLYHVGLGLDITVASYPGALFLSAGGYHHHLAANTWARDAQRATADEARLLEWEMILPAADDLTEAAASLEAAGHAVSTAGDGCTVSEPWGTRLRLVAEPQERRTKN